MAERETRVREGRLYHVVVIQEAGLDGFWIHRALEAEGWVASHVVDAASIAVSRWRRAKTDRIDGETLVRTLMAWMRGEPRVCSIVRVPAAEDGQSTAALDDDPAGMVMAALSAGRGSHTLVS
ncbi:transposase [Rhizorhapis suberifaciens]|uniref:Transposase n=1 Tax=Rhizorhapis suberifaciens TaxID=13656 RepID=A0A840HX52_9SPHN|nr:transposase [Rhizorhapis suberifaciens]